jgi:hypothetical protein
MQYIHAKKNIYRQKGGDISNYSGFFLRYFPTYNHTQSKALLGGNFGLSGLIKRRKTSLIKNANAH